MSGPSETVCRAPSVSLYLDVNGRATACGANQSVLLGRVGEQSLLELWRGPVAARLRAALAVGDLTMGCDRCRTDLESGHREASLAAGFDRFEPAADLTWPRRLELALSSTCNLQCLMCSGEFSSAIRTGREGLPRVPPHYGEPFFEELRPFLAHLEQVRFLGGEPFLAEENFRVWELLLADGHDVESNVTTNGTRWSSRVERVLDALPFSIGVSVDGFRAETVERIRRGATHTTILANIERFRAHTARWGTSFSLTYCLMVDNWTELGEFLRWATDLDGQVYVNPVVQPPRHSLYHLPLVELDEVLAGLEQQAAAASGLGRNDGVLPAQLDRLRAHRRVRAEQPAEVAPSWEGVLRAATEAGPDVDAVRAALAGDERLGEVGVLRSGPDERIRAAEGYLGLEADELVGRSSSSVRDLLFARHGQAVEVLAESQQGGVTARALRYRGSQGATTMVIVVFRPPGGEEIWRIAGLDLASVQVQLHR